MKINIFRSENKIEWDSFIKKTGGLLLNNVYQLPDYLDLYKNKNSIPEAFALEYEKNFFYISYLKREINKKILDSFYDFETAYGYSGPITNSKDKEFLNLAWKNFFDYCKNNKILAGFIRFNPLLENHLISSQQYLEVKYEKDIVIKSIKENEKINLNDYSPDVRNKINKANKNGIFSQVSSNIESINEFKKIYVRLMKEKKTEDYYFFSDNYFLKIYKNLKNNFFIILAKREEQVIGGALVLTMGDHAILHLSATLKKFSNLGIASFLRHEVIKTCFEMEIKKINFGGGLTPEHNDSLLKFKKGFSKEIKKYFIGKFVSNEKMYKEACSIWDKNYKKNNLKYSKYFLKYNYIKNIC